MIRLFFKTNLKEDKIFRLLLMVQLTIITCIYFVACYLWDDYQNGNIINENIEIYIILLIVGYIFFWGIYTIRKGNTFETFNFLGMSSEKIIIYYLSLDMIVYMITYVISLFIIYKFSWDISETTKLWFIIGQFPILCIIYLFVVAIGLTVLYGLRIREKKSDTFFKNNKD